MSTEIQPREGMMAVVRNRRAMITGVQPYDAAEHGRYHLVEVDYTDGLGAESDQLLWEVEPGRRVVEPSTPPLVESMQPMELREFDAMVRAARWSALTPTLPFSGLAKDRPPLASPLYGAVALEAYQLVPLLRALEMPRVTLMLADAVGLGKTIQAGLILRELMLRRRIRRVLVICPAALRTQWREELEEKFSLPFQLVDRPHQMQLQRQMGIHANPWLAHERIIASYHYLKQPDVLEQFRAVAEPGHDGTPRWDLLIVDEAHNLAPSSFGRDSDLSKMLQAIAPWFEHRLFLTATPHNGHTRSFSGLLEALDPVRFSRKTELTAQDRAQVSQVVIRRLKSQINNSYIAMGEPPRFSTRFIKALPPLRFGALERTLQIVVHDLRKAVQQAVAADDYVGRTASNFALEVLSKRLLSGPWAFGQSWLNLVAGLEDAETVASAEDVRRARAAQEQDPEDDAEQTSRQQHAERTVGAWLRPFRDQLQEPIRDVSSIVEQLGIQLVPRDLDPEARRAAVDTAASRVTADARFKTLSTWLDQTLRQGAEWRSDERVVIFTEYLNTLEYLRARLVREYDGEDVMLQLVGGMREVDRDAVKLAFNDPNHPVRILLATDAAGEGLNLQRSCRYLLHWDIPWNPGRMEQRNGRLDRHGQARDVTVFHFDSLDDDSVRFLGKVLAKRSQTREDRVATDDLFASAILSHFENDESPQRVEAELNMRLKSQSVPDDIPEGQAIPGADEQARLEILRADVDLSPATLRETLETALSVGAPAPKLPRFEQDPKGRDRLKRPVPSLWTELVDATIRLKLPEGGRGPLPAVVFDPSYYVQDFSGRPVYVPEADSKLLHLGHELYHRVMTTFARYRFPGGVDSASRWVVRRGAVPAGLDGVVQLSVEELAVNELREPCHHWVRTLRYAVRSGELAERLPDLHAGDLPRGGAGDVETARELWDDVSKALKRTIKTLQSDLQAQIELQLSEARGAARDTESERFDRRIKEIQKERENTAKQVAREAEKKRGELKKGILFENLRADIEKQLAELEAEVTLRREHYNRWLGTMREERKRVLERVLPKRYALRGEARVYPIAVEIRLPGGES